LIAFSDLPSISSSIDFLGTVFERNLSLWQSVVDAPDQPFHRLEEVLDDIVDEGTFSEFHKMCILRCLRIEAVGKEIQSFVEKTMGTQFIEPPPFNLLACYEDSKCDTPLIFVLTPGADPMTQLYALAEQMGFSHKLASLSLGQGQGPKAERAIEDAANRGSWVCLQNCHLAVSWLPRLEKICEELSPDTLHPDFRLWLTSEPSPHFPSFILQNSVKMTNEPPKGMRANLVGSFEAMDDTWFDDCQRREEFKKMVYSLCFFHASVIERRKFGVLGWNIQDVFSIPDLRISMDQLKIFLDQLKPKEPIPYAALSYLAGECNYGGRVTDDKDRRCLMNVLSDFYNPHIHEESYSFSSSGIYTLPERGGSLDSYKQFIRNLPINETPEVFGLHENADISCDIKETNALLSSALSLQPRTGGGDGKTWDQQLSELAKDIEGKLPAQFDIERALLDFPVLYEESMNTVLTQELLRFNTLTERMKESLRDVQKAIRGEVVMSGELEQMGNSIVMGQVPDLWSSIGYPSLKSLGPWTLDLLERLDFLKQWMDSGTSPPVFWISGFFFTQAFITGTLQNYARKHNIPIDEVAFDFIVLTADEMERADVQKPEDGAYVRGLFMEGARWDESKKAIAESEPRKLFVSMPYIHLLPDHKDNIPDVKGVPEHFTGDPAGTAHVYMCPVYKISL
jgi:dynein heavy chain